MNGYHFTETGSRSRLLDLEMRLGMELSVEQRQYKRLASGLRMALVMDNPHEALSAIAAVKAYVALATPLELTDFLERACVWSEREVVEALMRELGPVPYRGWALALALRCARADIAECLMDAGVCLLEDPVVPEDYPGRERVVLDLVRGDITASSPRFLEDAEARSVSSEIFHPFGPSDQLLGSDYARSSDIATSCSLVAECARLGRFTPDVFDDICRSALLCASHAFAFPSAFDPKTAHACLELAQAMLSLHNEGKGGTERIALLAADFIVPRQDERLLAFICEYVPSAFYARLRSQTWLKDDTALVARMVGHLRPGSEYDNGVLMCTLARGGYFDELQDLLGWAHTFTPTNLDRAIEVSSEAGHAEISTWLLTIRQDIADTEVVDTAHSNAASEPGHDLGDLSDLLL